MGRTATREIVSTPEIDLQYRLDAVNQARRQIGNPPLTFVEYAVMLALLERRR